MTATIRRDDVEAVARLATDRADAELVDWRVEPVGYPALTPTTAALERVSFTLAGDASGPAALFVKTIQSLRHSPFFAFIPPMARDAAVAAVPWRNEANLYGSGLLDGLPARIRGPIVYRIDDLGDDRIRIWMEDVPTDAAAGWDLERYADAARALGRLAGSGRAAATSAASGLSGVGHRRYASGRIMGFHAPALRDPATWAVPVVASAVDPHLREDLLGLLDRLPAILDLLDRLPQYFGHGDACPQNLLVEAGRPEGFVAVDWGFAGPGPVGQDLGQLLVGRAENGELDADELAAVDATIVPAYVSGLRDEGSTASEDEVRRGYVGALLVRSAFTALPIELLSGAPAGGNAPDTTDIFTARARYARFVVDLGHRLGEGTR